MKKQVPIVGIDDGGFRLFEDKEVWIFAVVMKGASHVEGIMQDKILIDSSDPSKILIDLIQNSIHFQQIHAILLKGVTIGGFGVLDLNRIHETLNKPIIVIIDREPQLEEIREALLKNVPDGDSKWKLISSFPKPTYEKSLNRFIQCWGIQLSDAVELIKHSTKVGKEPEVLRIAQFLGQSYYKYNERNKS